MDGSLSIIQACTGQLMATERVHIKYLTHVAWSMDGKCIATCSHDQSVGVHSVQLRVAGEEAGSGTGGGESTDVAAAVEGAVGKAQESLVVTMSTLHKVRPGVDISIVEYRTLVLIQVQVQASKASAKHHREWF